MRPVHSVALLLSFVVNGGCNSTLKEFRCTQASNCIDSASTIGRCEASGHCSFVDTSCLGSGFRFGDNSGDESGQCVSEVPIDVDAGVVDAQILLGPPPIARISTSAPGVCGLSLTVDASDSEAFDGATVEFYTWTLLNENNGEIDTFTGQGDALLAKGIHRRGGNHQAPTINFPSYHGFAALRANTNPGLNRTTIFQSGFELNSESYRLFFAVSMGDDVEADDPSVTVSLNSPSDSLPLGTFEVFQETFVGHTTEFTIPPGFEIGGNATLLFEFEGEGERWLDNVALVETLSGNVITDNESFESGQENPWFLGDGIEPEGGLSARGIENIFREQESYVVRLEVTDTNGQSSNDAELKVVGGDCLAPF